MSEMRQVFWGYALFIAAGILFCLIVGLNLR